MEVYYSEARPIAFPLDLSSVSLQLCIAFPRLTPTIKFTIIIQSDILITNAHIIIPEATSLIRTYAERIENMAASIGRERHEYSFL